MNKKEKKSIAFQFYAGLYSQVVSQTFDAKQFSPEDTAFAVGALTFVDRAEDALACYEVWKSQPCDFDPKIDAGCQFFLGLADARAGHFDRSARWFLKNASAYRRHTDPWVRALVFQGLACQRFFTGRFHLAAAHALRALKAAHEARFEYAMMLSTDLRGHALVQTGHFQRGISLLEQAKTQATRLGLVKNVYAIECSVATYAARFIARPEALSRLEQLLEAEPHDSYSFRYVLSETAVQRAWRGRNKDALSALQLAQEDALRKDTRRAKVATLLAKLHVDFLSREAAACRPTLEEALALVDARDVGFRAELLLLSARLAKLQNDDNRFSHTVKTLESLALTTQHIRARAALDELTLTPTPSTGFAEDEVTPLLKAVATRDTAVLPKLLSLGFLGLLPNLMGLEPSKRIWLLPEENCMVVENHGNLLMRVAPPRWAPTLLKLLSTPHCTKESLVLGLWNIRNYHPERHDPPIRTMIHRIRSILKPYDEWVAATTHGYQLTVPLQILGALAEKDHEPQRWDLDETLLEVQRATVEPKTLTPAPEESSRQLILSRLENGSANIKELSRAARVSQSTALRALRKLLRDKRVRKTGYARSTQYILY